MTNRTRVREKRTSTFGGLARATVDLLAHSDQVWRAMRRGGMGRPFAERIMLAVSQVNDCRYCLFVHSRAAVAAGVEPAELASLLSGELQAAPADELVALHFAQHYAATGGHPEPAASAQLVRTYGPARAADILNIVRVITVANLAGNAFDALLGRLAKRPSP